MQSKLTENIGKAVVIDTNSRWVYMGIIEEVSHHAVRLGKVDVHDSRSTMTSDELYIINSKTTGIKQNRRSVWINLDFVVSFSLLSQVVEF